MTEPSIKADGWLSKHLGYFYLRMGDTLTAIEYFKASIRSFRQDFYFRETAWSHWGRAIAHAYDNDLNAARREFLFALQCSPGEFRRFLEEGEEYAIAEDEWLSDLINTRPQFKEVVSSLISTTKSNARASTLRVEACSELNPDI